MCDIYIEELGLNYVRPEDILDIVMEREEETATEEVLGKIHDSAGLPSFPM